MYRATPGSQSEQVGRLLTAGVLVVFAPTLPFGNYLIYPFMILATWFHEMGHGLTALAFGYEFERLVIYSNGSGLAESSLPADASRFSRALIAAGGPLGPSLIGAALILASAKEKFWRPALYLLAFAIAISTGIWVRSSTGWFVLPAISVGLGLLAWRGKAGLVRFMLQFLGMLAALSMFMSWDYLFMESARIGGQVILSDTGAIEANLFLPHWFWALTLIAIATLLIGASLKYALRRNARSTRWR
ncbi:M50 family metallopeptidase [Altererythrobacter ishigakiensis]|uniref:Peptidase M50B-like protein n=1 Tax=Altererythrobacter ishigakiensis TaxID=476157 RepID=A0A562UTH8_9SPHN|nr:M50 family metallopeptidase [Altererythrobacter ishigakiensis]TWJ08901.1 peptidase M50B-like protein [Altererythrobacter ishigakiensis]